MKGGGLKDSREGALCDSGSLAGDLAEECFGKGACRRSRTQKQQLRQPKQLWVGSDTLCCRVAAAIHILLRAVSSYM